MAATKSGYEGKIAGLYDLDRTLGKGHFAVVKLARHVFTGQLVAVKVIDKTKLDALAMGHLLQEVRCMKLVQHPNVVRLYEVIDTHSKLYLILELGDGGDMYDYILRHEGGVAEETTKVHFAQIVRAIAYCHCLHVVHRDLKPENVVFFRQQGTVKLTDFGFSNHFQPGTMLMTSCGSLAYSAPEILLGEEYDAPAVDIWSLGVILYMLVCGHPPFQEANDSETLIMIMDCRYNVPDHVSAECKDLISRMLQRDPSKRASLVDIEAHPWLQGVDPSPSGHSAAPLTSHRSLSPHEHELILQAMTSGNIADRDTIQEALEADRYNHITATYYLLGERILRDKQEQNCLTPEQRHAQRPLSEPLDLVEGRSPQADPLRGATLAPVTVLGSLSPGFPRRGVCESGDLLAPKPSRQDGSFADFGSPSPSVGLSLRSVAPDPVPAVKSLGALQQICEEEEEEEDEGEGEAPLALQPSKPSLVVSAEPSSQSHIDCLELKAQGGLRQLKVRGKCAILAEEGEHQEEDAENGPEKTSQDLATSISKVTEEHRVENTSKQPREDKEKSETEDTNHNEQTKKEDWGNAPDQLSKVSDRAEADNDQNLQKLDVLAPSLGAVQCCLGQREPSKDTLEDNNNTPSKPKLLDKGVISAPCGSPRSLPKNHCVDLGPDGVEMRRTGGEGEKMEETQTKPQQGQRVSRDAGTDIKNKNVNLRDRLLQFPLCEKALSFNIQPTSKEKLLPFAQYNCCHVL
ncbi:SNF related kinase b [Colossoma macropomum]|uniref:SNF related kinase b n=1 Tax=Colossoma macropomum TaxID=42526 RepID=UPI001865538F|nr:SNF related kinase b [Colossoma macropomum]